MSASFDALGTTWNLRGVRRLNKVWLDAPEINLTGANLINAAGQTFATIANGGSLLDPRIADIQITRLERFEDDHTTFSNAKVDLVAQYDWNHTRDVIDIYNF